MHTHSFHKVALTPFFFLGGKQASMKITIPTWQTFPLAAEWILLIDNCCGCCCLQWKCSADKQSHLVNSTIAGLHNTGISLQGCAQLPKGQLING